MAREIDPETLDARHALRRLQHGSYWLDQLKSIDDGMVARHESPTALQAAEDVLKVLGLQANAAWLPQALEDVEADNGHLHDGDEQAAGPA